MYNMLEQLEQIIQDRKLNPRSDSYTNKLFDKGLEKIAQKVGEEGVEVVIASLCQSRERQIEETADLFYHLLVLLASLDISLEDVFAELEKRHKPE